MIDHAPQPTVVEKPWGKFEQYTHNVLRFLPASSLTAPGSLESLRLLLLSPGVGLSSEYRESLIEAIKTPQEIAG